MHLVLVGWTEGRLRANETSFHQNHYNHHHHDDDDDEEKIKGCRRVEGNWLHADLESKLNINQLSPIFRNMRLDTKDKIQMECTYK